VRWFVAALAASIVIVAAAAEDAPRMAVVGAPILTSAAPLADPFPIVRIRASEQQLLEALKENEAGAAVRMPRATFEARVQKAARAAAASRDPPRLVEAHYSATLSGDNFIGDGQWTIVNGHASAVVLPLEALKVAIHAAIWADGGEAVLGSFGQGASSGLWTPPGRHVLYFKWSAAGTGNGAARNFDLRLPPCPASVIDLALPADRIPSTTADALLTGPSDGSDGKSKRWMVRFGERSRLDLSIRGPGDAAGIALASVAAKYDIVPGRLDGSFEFDLRTTHGSVAEWAFDIGSNLTVTDVVANDRAGWRVDPAMHRLHVRLRQPASAGKVVIAATAALPPRGQNASLPWVRAANALTSDERIELRTHPDLELEHLDPLDYRTVGAGAGTDGTRQVQLRGALLPGGSAAERRPPTIRIATAHADFTTDEALDWRVEAGRMLLDARVDVRVRRGPLFRMSFRIPAGYTFDRATGADELLAFTGAAAGVLEVEFGRPLATGQRAEFVLHFRGPVLSPRTSRVPVPRFAPIGAAERDGWIGFSSGPSWTLQLRLHPGAAAADELDWPDTAPPSATALYYYRGIEPSGELVLAPVHPVFSAAIAGNGKNATIAVKVTEGQLSGLVVFERGEPRLKRTWRSRDGKVAIAAATPASRWPGVLPIGAIAPVFAAANLAQEEPGSYWFVRFARPAAGDFNIETTAADGGELKVLGASNPSPQMANEKAQTQAPGAAWAFESVYLITRAAGMHTLAVFGGTIAARGGTSLPIEMPPGAEVRAACVGGYWLDPGRCQLTSQAATLDLPVPAGGGLIRFEVRYRLPTSSHAMRSVASRAPRLPGDSVSIARWWAFPRGVAAIWPLGVHQSGGEPPILLGEPLDRPPGELAFSSYPHDEVWIAPARWMDATAAVATALLGALAWIGVRRRGRTLGLLAFAAATCLGAAYWLGPPAWSRGLFLPLVAALAGAAAIAVARGYSRRRAPLVIPASAQRGSSRRLATGAGLAILLLTAVSLRGQNQPPRDVVFLLPDNSAVVSQATLDRLDALASPPQPGAIIVAAAYEGKVEDGLARMTARFTVHSFHAEVSMNLPLVGARLERVEVDGKAALPSAIRPDQFAIPVVGRGRHSVEARFAVPIAATGPEREVRFGVPESPDAHIAFQAAAAARQLQAVGRFGERTATIDKDGARLEAALGALRTVQLRWREGAGGTAAIGAREGCVWEVAETGHTLTACYQLRIDSGSVSTLRFDLPASLEPTRVATRSLDVAVGQNVLRDWSIGKESGGLRPLKIDLNGPTDGRVLVTLECALRGVPSRTPVLPFPRLSGMSRIDAIYGLRTAAGVAIESIGRAGVIDFAADALLRDFGAVADLRLSPSVPVVAFSPRSRDPELRPVLRAGADLPTMTQNATWNATRPQAAGSGTISMTAKEAISMLEFGLAATAIELRGADVAAWAQTNGRVQVWFRKPIKDARVEWIAAFSPNPAGKGVPVPLAFEPPLPTPLHARIGSQTVRIVPENGWGVRIDRDKGWTALPSAERAWVFQSGNGGQAPPRLNLFPPSSGAPRGFAIVERTGSGIAYRAAVEMPVPANRPQHLVLHASGVSTGVRLTLDVPPGVGVREMTLERGSRQWSLDVPASAATLFRVTVAMQLPGHGKVVLPRIDLRGGAGLPHRRGVVHWLGLIDANRDAKLEGTAPADLNQIGKAWPGEADRLRRAGGSVWRVVEAPAIAIQEPSPRKPSSVSTAPLADAKELPMRSESPDSLGAAVAWSAAVLFAGFLFVRWPHATWPEQVGLLGGLLGLVIAGAAIAGLGAYAAARAIWFFKRIPTR